MRKDSDIYRQYLVWGLSGPILFLNFWVLGQVFQYFEQVITIVLVAAILAILLSYPVHWLTQRKVNRLPAILMVLAAVVSGVGLLGFTVIPLVIDQANQLLALLPNWVDGAGQQLSWLRKFVLSHGLKVDLNQFIRQLEQITQTLVSWLPGLAIGTLGRLLDTIFILILAVYMLLYGQRMWRGLVDVLPTKLGSALDRSLQFNLRQFFISQFLLALFMLLGLTPIFLLLQIKFALLFALLVGLSNLIPFIGATLGIGLVTLLALLQGVWPAFWVALTAISLQQFKDNVISPRLLGRITGLNPIWIFVALLLGARIAGVLGVILAIPIAGTIQGTIEQLRVKSSPVILSSADDATSGQRAEI
ncbi:AI-2E family transporter [Altericista sp. CCNU0014]|uniref:AI-2E family transporter n=1 Tax=Altericista sp. CCNU0014 TaxID=3082949 RepID=UPI00384CE417